MDYKKIIYFFLLVIISLVHFDCKKHFHIHNKVIALTFDDGPDKIYTPEILDILKAKNVKASFFIIGKRIRKNPDVVKRMFYEGHVIGNHTYTHLDILSSDINIVKQELAMTENIIDSLLGKCSKFVRAPWGHISNAQIADLSQLGYKVVRWDIDSEDWKINQYTTDEIINNVVSKARPGKVVLLHCADYKGEGSRQKTVDALSIIIEKLQNKGYKFVTLDEMNK